MRSRTAAFILAAVFAIPVFSLRAQAPEAERERVLRNMITASFAVKDYARAADASGKLSDMGVELSLDDRMKWAKALELSGRAGEALAMVRKLCEETDPLPNNLAEEAANLSVQVKNFEEAHEWYSRLAGSDPDNRDWALRSAETLSWALRHKEAAEEFRKLCDRWPEDADIRREAARELCLAGYYKDAMVHYRWLADKGLEADDVAREIAREFSSEEKFDEAVGLYRAIISRGDDSRETLLEYARVTSWKRDYDESESAYDKLIERYPEEWTIKREKARMLGWSGDYKRAMEMYESIISEHPDNTVIQKEAAAKNALYLDRSRPAAAGYEDLISLEPDNLEALFDLAQIYSRTAEWPQAEVTYEKLIAIDPKHFRAIHALKRLRTFRNSWKITGGFTNLRRRGRDRTVDVKVDTFSVDSQLWLDDNIRLDLMVSKEYYYDFYDYRDLEAIRPRLKLSYWSRPDWDVGVEIGFRDFLGDTESTDHYRVQYSRRITEILEASVMAQREDFLENSRTARDRTTRDDRQVSFRLRPLPPLLVEGSYMHSNLSDHNEKETVTSQALYQVMREPVHLYLGYRYESWDFDDDVPAYFSPDRFEMHGAFVEIRRYFNKNEMYWGSRDFYLKLGSGITWDSGGDRSVSLSGGLHRDFSDRFSAGIEGMTLKGPEYDEDSIAVRAVYFWGD